ncbi:pyridoxamine 5'-phosphate oxidase family protein [Actinocorallia sp. A-T 12471]|uniref:pyridoxamine 5'-phosphate oxidase family protein n=1 Tax=Actinocorallia sp. A-T 12471 TaxID=3089813 RepID=UPI0029D010AF|nr:pyridoxamine 5'-phosphate oxidase family protein [Actinocorallia sp. A-T 12471]MDX6743147.1 pyridoxamine 5'-phosphate oxidase family protein [Actinocorallia sp. A-T 12471]
MPLSRDERQTFFAEPHVAALSVAEPGRGPLTVPVWYQYAPGEEVWILTGRDSRKAKRIAESGRFTLMIDRLSPTIRYVGVEGPVTSTEEATLEQLKEISARYLPPDQVDAYVESALREHGPSVVIRMRPEHWISSDLGNL